MRFLPPALLCALIACSPSLDVPPTTEIRCSSSAECPEHYVCLVSIERCVIQDGDVTLPHLVDAVVSPLKATRGSVVTIRVTADAELAGPPELSMAWGDGESAAATPVSHDGLAFDYTYTVDNAEPEVSLDLEARFLSAAAVPNTFELPRALTLDFTPPELVTATNRVELVAPAGSLQPTLSAVAYDTTIRALFQVTEEITKDLVVATAAPDGVTLVCQPPQGTFYTCTGQLTAGAAPRGTYTLTASVRDVAGNAALLTIGSFGVDTSAPTALSTSTPGTVVLRRTPHGSLATNGVSKLSLTGAAGAAEPGVTVIAWDRNATSGIQIARATAAEDGSFAFDLPGVDRADVFVQAVDGAGNASALARVRDGVWTASLSDKVFGNDFDNPHKLTARGYALLNRDREQQDVAAVGLLALADGQSATTASTPHFTAGPASTDTPSARGGCGMVHDVNRGQSVLFGGYVGSQASGTTDYDDTWAFDGFTWRKLYPSTTPQGRDQQGLVFDRVRGVTVMFGGCIGGYTCTRTLGDTWTFDGDDWNRACWPGCTADQCTCAGVTPSPRGAAAMFWDDDSGEVVLFGGRNGTSYDDVMWSWNGTRWKTLTPAHRPSARALARVATNPVAGETLLVGGQTAGGIVTDTWSWSDGDWTQKSASSGLSPSNTMWFDERTATFVGYFGDGNQRFNWDGTSWGGLLPMTYAPNTAPGNDSPQRQRGGLSCGAYEPYRDAQLLFGGCGDTTCRADYTSTVNTTWLVTNGILRGLTLGARPPARAYAGIAPLASQTIVVLDSGRQGRVNSGVSDVWSWSGWEWTLASVGSAIHSQLGMAALGDTRVVRGPGYYPFNGYGQYMTASTLDGATWSTWSGSAGYYIEPVTGSAPGYPAMAYKAGLGALFYRGSTNGQATWLGTWTDYYAPWNTHGDTAGVLWTAQASVISPATADEHAMAACPGLPGVLLFGGYSGAYLDETWLWNSGWTKLAPAHHPSARGRHTMMCDSARNAIYLVGGTNQRGADVAVFDDVWEWDGTDWREVSPVSRPPPRIGASFAYMPWAAQGVLFGGFATSPTDTTYVFDDSATRYPTQTFLAAYGEAGVWDSADPVRVDVTWHAGGTGMDSAGARSGAQLAVWDRGRFSATGAANDAPAAAPEAITWSTATDSGWRAYDETSRRAYLRRLFGGDAHTIVVQAAPRGQNRTLAGGASLATDYVEVTVAYHLTID